MSTTRRAAWFNCYAGIAGDMALGSLVDAGADLGQLLRLLERLPIGGWSLDFEPVMRNGLAATHAVVGVRGDSVVRTWMHILGVLEEARLPDRVRERSIAAFSVLADAEGHLHRRSPAQVHFHEVGGHDTIVDIVGTASALEVLDIDVVTASAIATGSGVVRSSHGLLPNPAPAVVELLTGLPTVGRDVPVELTTPTGAAMLRAWGAHFGPMPSMTVSGSGFGAGTREIDGMPNCTQVVLGEMTERASVLGLVEGAAQPLVVLEANLDDATGETLAHAVEVMMDAGAADAWITPIVMKKGRPAHCMSVLCDPAQAAAIGELLRSETGTLGIRAHGVDRWASPRTAEPVAVDGGVVSVKVGSGRAKAEHDDAVKVARRTGRPVIEIKAEAEAAWRNRDEGEAAEPGDTVVTLSALPSGGGDETPDGTGPPASTQPSLDLGDEDLTDPTPA